MASRKKDPAALRTVDMFTGMTKLEEAESALKEEAPELRESGPRDFVAEAEECAVRWLGLDAFHEGDDVKVAIHPAGHAVIVLVHTARDGSVRSASTHKLSRQQWAKLRILARQA